MVALGTHEEVPPLVALYKIAGMFIFNTPVYHRGSTVGSNVQPPSGEGIHPQPRVISQPSGRGCNGNETQRGNGQHHHEDR
jgi:hypothetical protein